MAVKRTEAKTSKAKPASPRKRKQGAAPMPTPEHIAVRAYYLHLEGGHDPLENWLRAERELFAA